MAETIICKTANLENLLYKIQVVVDIKMEKRSYKDNNYFIRHSWSLAPMINRVDLVYIVVDCSMIGIFDQKQKEVVNRDSAKKGCL